MSLEAAQMKSLIARACNNELGPDEFSGSTRPLSSQALCWVDIDL